MAGTVRIAILANAAQARREIGTVQTSAGKLSGALSKARAPAAAALGLIAAGAVKSAKSASDLNETINKSNTIFGSNAGAINTWASGAAKNLGLSKQAALDSAAGFGDMFSQIGFAGDQAAKMSTDVVGLSADLGSFNNLPTADVSDRISAAFRGEYDSLQTLIPNINAARVESEAMAATGKKSAKDLTAQEKATAVLAIVQKDGARAAGDFAKTSTGAANASKIAAAGAQDLAAGVGTALLPAYQGALAVLGSFVGVLNAHQGAILPVVIGLAALAAVVLAVSAAQAIAGAAMAVARGAVIAYTAVQWLLNAALTANPIGLIVVGIALLIAGLVLAYQKSETFRAVVTAALNGVKIAAAAVWNAVKTAALVAWRVISAYVRTQIAIVKAVITGVRAVASAVWNAIKSAATSAFNGVKNAVSGAINSAKDKFNSLKSFASSALSRIKGLFSPGALVNAGRQLIAGLARGISERISSAVDAVRRGVQRIKNLLPGSPIKEGPLKSWNNGGAGKRLMALLAGGIAAGSGNVRTTLADALDPASSLSRISLGGTAAGAGGIVVNVQAGVGDPAEIGREVAGVLNAYLGLHGKPKIS